VARQPITRERLPLLTALSPALWVIRRRMTLEPWLLALVTVVCVASLILASIPRYVNRVSDQGIRAAVGAASVQQAGISVVIEDRIGLSGTGDSFADLARRGADYQARLAPSLQDVTGERSYLVESPAFQLIGPDGQPLYASLLQYPSIRIRYDSDVWKHVSLVDGRLPAARERMRPSEALGYETPNDTSLRVFEIAVTAETAAALRIGLNDRFLVTPSAGPSLPAGALDARPLSLSVIMEIVGLIAINDPADPYWFGDPRLHRPDVSQQGELVYINAAAIAALDEAVYSALYQNTLISSRQAIPWRYSWRYHVEAARFDAGALDVLARDLRNLETTHGPVAELVEEPDEASVQTSLPGIIATFHEQQRIFSTMLALAGIGLLALALALLGLLAALATERRRAAIVLMRGRGASGTQLVVAQITEGLLLGLPAALLGLLLALALVDGRASSLSLPAALLVAAGTTLLLAAAVAGLVRPPLGTLQREVTRPERPSAQRLVTEAVVIVLAVAGLVVLRRRGLDGGGDFETALVGDPYLAAVPVLLSLAAGLLVLRLFPLPMRLGAHLAARRRAAVLVLGLRRVSRQSSAAGLPLIVLLLATAMSVFALILATAIEHAQSEHAWRAVGADYRIESTAPGRPLPTGLDLRAIDGVEALARAAVIPGAQTTDDQAEVGRVTLVAIDAAAHANVTAGTPVDAGIPAGFERESARAPAGAFASPIPAIVSTAWLAESGLGIGDTIDIRGGGLQARVVIIDARERFAGFAVDGPFMLVPFASIADLSRDLGAELQPTLLFVRGRDGLDDRLAAARPEQSANARVLSRRDIAAQSRNAPFAHGLTGGFRLALLLAASCAALATMAAQVLSARGRARDLGYLRTIGMSPRQALGLTLVEQLPPAAIAVITGAGLGAAIAVLIEPGLDVRVFAGADGVPVTHQIPWLPIAAVVAALLAVVLATIVLVGITARRTQLGQVMRVGE
jgi:putative ABC transport system permease protein